MSGRGNTSSIPSIYPLEGSHSFTDDGQRRRVFDWTNAGFRYKWVCGLTHVRHIHVSTRFSSSSPPLLPGWRHTFWSMVKWSTSDVSHDTWWHCCESRYLVTGHLVTVTSTSGMTSHLLINGQVFNVWCPVCLRLGCLCVLWHVWNVWGIPSIFDHYCSWRKGYK